MQGKYVDEKVTEVEKDEVVKEDVVKEEVHPEKVKTSDTPKYSNISIDTKIKDVIDLDSKGYLLNFESEPDKFKKLPEEVVKELSGMNRDRYRTSYECYKGEIDTRDHPEKYKTPGVEITSRYASATARLEIEGEKPGMRYCWATDADVRRNSRMGYKICHDPDVETFHKDPDGVHRVADERGTELVLMEAPETVWKEHRKRVRDLSNRRKGAVENTAERNIRQTGYKTFRPAKGPKGGGPDFTPPVDETGKPLNGPG
jgi:hypothetical protein